MTTTPIPIRRDVPPLPPRLTPQVAGLHTMAAFLTVNALDATDILFLADGDVLIDLHGVTHPRGALRRWLSNLDAAAYTETPHVGDGNLHTDLVVTGLTPTGAFVKVIARELVRAAS